MKISNRIYIIGLLARTRSVVQILPYITGKNWRGSRCAERFTLLYNIACMSFRILNLFDFNRQARIYRVMHRKTPSKRLAYFDIHKSITLYEIVVVNEMQIPPTTLRNMLVKTREMHDIKQP